MYYLCVCSGLLAFYGRHLTLCGLELVVDQNTELATLMHNNQCYIAVIIPDMA